MHSARNEPHDNVAVKYTHNHMRNHNTCKLLGAYFLSNSLQANDRKVYLSMYSDLLPVPYSSQFHVPLLQHFIINTVEYMYMYVGHAE